MARLLRNVPILVLWFWYFGQEKSWGDPVTIFTGAIVIGLSFFIPIAKKTLIIFLFIQVILLGYLTFFATGGIWILILTNWLYVVEAMLMERERDFKIFAVLSVILQSFVLFFTGQLSWLALGFMLTFYFMAILGNHAINERTEIQEMYYEALTGEYRRLKRLARLVEEEARNEERTKIARDIHDSVGHKLTALLMQLEIFAMDYGYEKIAPLKKLASDSLEETRNAVKALKAKEIEGIATILQLIKKLESESFLEVHLTTKQGILSTKLTNEESVVLYRVIQEGLTNAMRHAHVREVYVEWGRSAIGHIEFLIKNRIPKKMFFTEGFGIKNLRERVEQLGGKLYAYQTESHFILKGHFPAKEGWWNLWNVLIAEDQKLVRQGLKLLLEQDPQIRVVAEADHGADVVQKMEQHIVDLVMMDIRMPVMDWLEATKIIKSRWPDVKILILTTFNDDEYAIQALKYGANAFMLKTAEQKELVTAVYSCMRGAMPIHEDVTAKVMPKLLEKEKKVITELPLTERELAITRLVGQGKTNKEISRELYLSVGTVKNHISQILQKLNLRDRTQLAIFAVKNDLS